MIRPSSRLPAIFLHRRNTRLRRLAVGLVAAAVALGTLALYARAESGKRKSAASRQQSYIRFEDREAGFALSYPRSWRRLEANTGGLDPQVRLLVGRLGTDNNLRVRVIPLQAPVVINDQTPAEDIAALQAELDKFIDQGQDVREVIRRDRVTVNGVPGWWYLYSFNDKETKKQGIHSHFFLFGTRNLYILVFQALPVSQYELIAGTFDRILQSFTVLEQKQTPPASSPTP